MRLGELSEALKSARSAADAEARNAIELVETRLVAALAGETLRGLPDLGDRVFGLRVEVEGSLFAKLPSGGRGVLILSSCGRLVHACKPRTAAFVQQAPRSMVVASLLIPYMRAVREALRIHLVSAEVRRSTFQQIQVLAGRITAAMV